MNSLIGEAGRALLMKVCEAGGGHTGMGKAQREIQGTGWWPRHELAEPIHVESLAISQQESDSL